MDAKALAKSKRAHSLHHSKKHQPNPTSRASASSVTANSDKKATSKQEKAKSNRSHGSKVLPSNLDRYRDEFDLDSEESPDVTTYNQASDAVAPKSKGADYTYLLDEAKAQSQGHSSSDNSSLFDDVFNGLYQGSGPLLSVEGQRLLSWISDDNFPYDDTVFGGQEASFFSLSLDSLSEQLSKASLLERLFIEPDVLPPELFPELRADSDMYPDQALPTASIEATETALDGQAPHSISEQNKGTSLSPEYSSYIPSTSRTSVSELTSTNHPLDDFPSIEGTSEKFASQVHADPPARGSVKFEATAAQAELDLLLDSFSETKFFDSTDAKKSSNTSSETQASSIHSVSVQHQWGGPDAASSASLNISLDDSLDDLLKETSNQTNSRSAQGIVPVHEVKIIPNDNPSTYQSDSKSKILDNFDAWFDTIK